MRTRTYEGEHLVEDTQIEPDGTGTRVVITCVCGNSFTATGDGDAELVAAHAVQAFENSDHLTPVRRPKPEEPED